MTENLISVNQQDEVLGEVEPTEAHEKGILHRTVHVFIVNNEGKLFCRQRSFDKKVYPGYWSTSMGTHVVPGETYEQAAKRGLANTLEIDCELQFVGKSQVKDDMENEISVVFVGHTDANMTFNPNEIQGGKFLSVEEIRELSKKENTTPHLIHALDHYVGHLK